VNLLENILGEDWIVTPAGGATGEAYFAQSGNQKLFLKRNSSPFLAVLSAEGIVPKLLWTKRLENGDVVTAQRWLQGRELKAGEMRQKSVAELLGKIHRSSELLYMLKRLGKEPLTVKTIYQEVYEQRQHQELPIVKKALDYLAQTLFEVEENEMVVCHCDVNHNNWLLTDYGDLYLIDWDGAMIADAAIDIGLLLYWYVPKEEWQAWFENYGMVFTKDLEKRMHWYVVAYTVQTIFWCRDKKREDEQQSWLKYLETLMVSE
jgi:thiamine kinase-like enzyme